MEFFKIFLAAILGGVVTQFFTVRILLIQNRSERVDRLCSLVDEATALAVDYWCTPYVVGETNLTEAKMMSHQTSVIRAIEAFESDDWTLKEVCDPPLLRFMDCFTGGEFSVVGRAKDVERAEKMFGASADLVDALLYVKRSWFRRLLVF